MLKFTLLFVPIDVRREKKNVYKKGQQHVVHVQEPSEHMNQVFSNLNIIVLTRLPDIPTKPRLPVPPRAPC